MLCYLKIQIQYYTCQDIWWWKVHTSILFQLIARQVVTVTIKCCWLTFDLYNVYSICLYIEIQYTDVQIHSLMLASLQTRPSIGYFEGK